MRIVVTGARGQLGRDLLEALADENPTALDHAALDVADDAAVGAMVAKLAPDVVLNTAAYNKVDLAEDEPAVAFRVNAFGPRALAHAAAAAGALLVHFSTDYVFGGDGRTPHPEEETPFPQSVYAVSKLAGEQFVRATAPLHIVIRTCGLYGHYGQGGKGGNFVETMLRLAADGRKIRVVDDQVLSPTPTDELAALVAELVRRWASSRAPELLGLYHATSSGSCSWYEFAAEIFRRSGTTADLERTSTRDYGARAPRPAYSVLEPSHLRRLGIRPLADWQDGLARYLATRG